MGGSEMDPRPAFRAATHGAPERSPGAPPPPSGCPPPTCAEVLEGALRDSAVGEGAEVPLSKVIHFYILCFMLLFLGAT